MRTETFGPVLYLIPFKTLEEAIAAQNDVAHGLSSAIFTDRLQHAERFLSASGSDCGTQETCYTPSCSTKPGGG